MTKNLDQIMANARSNKRSLRVGIDIDNTLIYIPVIAYINRKFGTSYTNEDFKDWGLNNFPREISDDVRCQFTNPEFMCRARGYTWSYPTIRDWHASGKKLFAVSRRAPNLYRDTWIQLEREFPGMFEAMYFVSPTDTKSRILRKLDVDVHIDDWDVEDTVKAGIPTWLITNDTTHYNHGLRSNLRLNQALELRYVKLDDKKWKQ